MQQIFENLRNKKPLVHCITNYVTVNDCANVILACGGSPIMAPSKLEVSEIVAISNALLINIGTLRSEDIEAMLKAQKTANQLGKPIIFDPVGAGVSKFRNDVVTRFINEINYSVIRGNASEIKTIALGKATASGVDADEFDLITSKNLTQSIEFAKVLSKKTGSIIAISGEKDIIADDKKAYVIKNGHEMMTRVTGTGCMLTALTAAFCAANPTNILKATACAVATMGICGELAYEKVVKNDSGTGSFRTYLIDEISKINYKKFDYAKKIELF